MPTHTVTLHSVYFLSADRSVLLIWSKLNFNICLQLFIIGFPDHIGPNPTCHLFLWEETGEPGKNPRLLAKSIDNLFPQTMKYSMTELELLTSVVGGSHSTCLSCFLLCYGYRIRVRIWIIWNFFSGFRPFQYTKEPRPSLNSQPRTQALFFATPVRDTFEVGSHSDEWAPNYVCIIHYVSYIIHCTLYIAHYLYILLKKDMKCFRDFFTLPMMSYHHHNHISQNKQHNSHLKFRTIH